MKNINYKIKFWHNSSKFSYKGDENDFISMRKLTIDEYKNLINVIITRFFIIKYSTLFFVGFSLIAMLSGLVILPIIFIGISLFLRLLRLRYITKYKFILTCFSMSIGLVDKEIFEKYNMTLPNPLEKYKI